MNIIIYVITCHNNRKMLNLKIKFIYLTLSIPLILDQSQFTGIPHILPQVYYKLVCQLLQAS